MRASATYNLFVRITALMLLIGVTMPAGLHAKQLIDFCLASQTEQSAAMTSEHDCHGSEPVSHEDDHMDHEECEGTLICACNIGHAPLTDQNWLQSSPSFFSGLVSVTILKPDKDPRLSKISAAELTYSTPPVFLLNSSFLN